VIDRCRSNGFLLPGKDKNDRKVQLETTALCESTATNLNLSASNKKLSSSTRDLVNTNTTLIVNITQKDEEIEQLKGKIAILEQPAAEPKKTPAKGSTKKMTVTPATVSTKKQQESTAVKDHDFIDNEKVSIKCPYSFKLAYAGKHGEVESSMKAKVTVRFEDGTKAITLSHKHLEHGWM
jgi:hypothetical protein